MSQSITLSNTAIRRDAEGRYSLNDLHKAAMASGKANKKTHQPANFLRSDGVQAFIGVLDSDPQNRGSVVTSKGGVAQGTYADELVALRYAAWINPAFEVEVYRTFRDARMADRAPADAPAAAPAVLNGQLALLECAARLLNVSESGKIVMLQKVGKQNGLDTGFLPEYAVDAAPDAAGGGSMPTKSLTELLREHDVKMSPAAFNRKLHGCGILRQMTRKNGRREDVKFWSVTEFGARFGKNVTSPASPRETQPHWYVDRFAELLGCVARC